jgi:hypothetical protein
MNVNLDIKLSLIFILKPQRPTKIPAMIIPKTVSEVIQKAPNKKKIFQVELRTKIDMATRL